jgi:hypothetical protein
MNARRSVPEGTNEDLLWLLQGDVESGGSSRFPTTFAFFW